MTAAQRRAVTVSIGSDEHKVEVKADLTKDETFDLLHACEAVYGRTRPDPRPKQTMGFGSQLSHTTPDQNVAGEPIFRYGGPNTA